jgi:hypothetical protein|tara:strand:+ start:950 stop:2017 length:1068 start_codon:yes stop_codon:yes gene_type:complete
MANYFTDLMKDFENPFIGVGDSFKGLNILGAEVPQEFEALKSAGLLSDEEYTKQVNAADTRGKRSAIIKGLLSFAGQNFNKNQGTIFSPQYLSKPLLTAMDASQKSFDKLAPAAMNIEKLKEFKRTKDKTQSLADIMAKGMFNDGKFNDKIVGNLYKEGHLAEANTVAAMIARSKAAIKTLKDTHTLKKGKDGIFYQIPLLEGLPTYVQNSDNGMLEVTDKYLPEKQIRSVGEGGLYDIATGEKVIEGVPKAKFPKPLTKPRIDLDKKLIKQIYEGFDVKGLNNIADSISAKAEEIRVRPENRNKTLDRTELLKMAIEEGGFARPSEEWITGFDPNIEFGQFEKETKKKKSLDEF